MELKWIVIENIKKYRKQKKISQMKLAELCDTSTSYIGEIEIGKKFPSIAMIEKIATVLEIMPHKLFMHDNENNFEKFEAEHKKIIIKKLQKAIENAVELL